MKEYVLTEKSCGSLKRFRLICLYILSGLFFMGSPLSGGLFDDDENESEPHSSIAVPRGLSKYEVLMLAELTLSEAISIALEEVPGLAVEAELESEGGFLLYEVEILTNDRNLVEVAVDPGNGSVLGLEEE